MPTVTQNTVKGYAHCVQPRCPGNNQVEVDAIRTETGHSYEDLGGDWPFVERSHVEVRFADEDDASCPHCGSRREVTLEQRKQYAPLSGHDPRGLLDIQASGIEFDPSKQIEIQRSPMSDSEREQLLAEKAALEARLADQDKAIARLEGFMLGKQDES